MPKIFIIAGEKSGDNLGGKLIASIKELRSDIKFFGIGSEEMEKQGLNSLFPMSEINLFGFAEIIPHLPNLLNRISQTVEEIEKIEPDIIITIDSPGFNYRVVRKLREKNINAKFVHYVAPSVWAYKEKRAEKTANLFDMLLCLLPWEPPYFEKHGLKTVFIGHPVFEELHIIPEEEKNELRKKYNGRIISILPGSRLGEVDRFLPTIKESIKKLKEKFDFTPIFLGTPALAGLLEKNLSDIDNKIIITDPIEKQKVLQISDAAISKSGTYTLEVSALKCPQVIFYKVNPISYFLIDRMLKTEFVNLANFSASRFIIPELIQKDFTADNIVKHISELLENKDAAQKQLSGTEAELVKLGYNSGVSSSNKAAGEVLKFI